MKRTLLLVALAWTALAAPGESPIIDLTLQESRAEVIRRFGPPERAARAGKMVTWQYDEFNDGEYSWSLTLESERGPLIAATRSWAAEQDLEAFFTGKSVRRTTIQGLAITARTLDQGRGLVAIGRHQLILFRLSDLPRLFSWLQPAFEKGPSRP